MRLSRRECLELFGGAGIALGGCGLRAPTAQAQGRAASLGVAELRSGLAVVSGAGGNVVVAARGEGLVVIDSGAAEHAAALRALLEQRYGTRPLVALFNTHWHLDHTGGNEALAAGSSLPIVAHENTRLWMSTEFDVEWENVHYERRPRAAWPTATFFTSDRQPLALDFAGESVRYGHLLEAHTDGDLYVQFPERNVIVAGGVVTAGRYPVLDYSTGGWIGGMVDATEKLIDLADDETLIVPDVGPAQRRADLAAQLEMLSTVRQRIEAIALEGRGVADMIAAEITKDFDARYGTQSAQFIKNAYEGMWWSRLRGIVA